MEDLTLGAAIRWSFCLSGVVTGTQLALKFHEELHPKPHTLTCGFYVMFAFPHISSIGGIS